MRIRNFRREDIPALAQLQQIAAHADGSPVFSDNEVAAWLKDPEVDATSNVFVITDDDDDLITWSQAGTLEGIEGEMVGYSLVLMHQDQAGYHLHCQGTVHPRHRRRNAGRALLICDSNRGQFVAADHIFAALRGGPPVYFDILLPQNDSATPRFARKCELEETDEPAPQGLKLYRREL
jgi:hypothetical protein